MARRSRRLRPLRALRRLLLGALLLFVLATVGPVLCTRSFDPPTSSFIVQTRLGAWQPPGSRLRVEHQWVPAARIAPAAGVAAVASEDQKFATHRGFDVSAIEGALAERARGGRLRGASTITQQVAKNLYLWPERSLLRKGLEAWFTVWLELLLPKGRILELYLNVAEFGPGVFGVEAAARRYFDRPASELGPREAALLAAVLPNPRVNRVDAPTPRLQERARWIQDQMRRLGGDAYLRALPGPSFGAEKRRR